MGHVLVRPMSGRKMHKEARRYHQLNASKDGFGSLHEQWILMSLLVAQYPIFCTERVLKIWYFVCNLRVSSVGKSHGVTHKWLADIVNSSSHILSASKTCFETMHMLWMSLLTVHHTIFHIERILQTCILLVI